MSTTRRATIDKLIITTPFEEPSEHWSYDRQTQSFELLEGRRPAGFVRATPGSQAHDDPGVFVELPLVNKIRPRIKAWRESGYPGVTGITKRLLAHWNDVDNRDMRFFFCQLEAVETLIWLAEAPAAETQGINVPGDGGSFQRLCAKMATGSGKTVVMAMVIAWQILNKVAAPQDTRFAKHVLVVAPGLTVRSRLQVLLPADANNYYDEFDVVPAGLMDKLRQGKVLVRNWHALAWETEERIQKRRSVDKRGAKSDEAYVREALGDMHTAKNILVINDEAHHAWRVGVKGVAKDDEATATVWVGGLDRIQAARGILCAYDFSATPFVSSGKVGSEDSLFDWIVSDFGLSDAVEAGLVKTPRVVVRDDAKVDSKSLKSRLYHIYNDDEVKEDLNRKAEAHEPLPDLVINGYYLLGKDWLEAAKAWKAQGRPTPPVMITVANRTETAARIRYAFDNKKIHIDELCEPDRVLQIDSKVLSEAEAEDEAAALDLPDSSHDDDDGGADGGRKLTKKERAELLRLTVDTVGKPGRPGEQIHKVISVGMLSEGWDAKTVTHIMGLRAFSSQLLCEQVVGRGLRRTAYEVDPETGLYQAEHVNIFGVPFTFLPHESTDGPPPPPPPPKIAIEPAPEKVRFRIAWPNVTRIDHVYRPQLSLDFDKVKPLTLDALDTATLAELAPVMDGKPDVTRLTEIELKELAQKFRLQKITFHAARDVYDQMKPAWKASREHLIAQIIPLVEQFLASDRLRIKPNLFGTEELRKRIVVTLNMTKIVQHLFEAIRFENTAALEPVFDSEHPIRATGDMRTWYTGRPSEVTQRSHINRCVFDSSWEATEAFHLDKSELVDAWVKNDHLGFEVMYVYQGVVRKYRPDFLIRLASGVNLALEVKGQDSKQNQTKREFLGEWVKAVNEHGGFGRWAWDVSRSPNDLPDILARAGSREEWPVLNKRRLELIAQKHDSGLSAVETEELAKLQQRATEEADRVAPLPFRELEALERRVAAKKAKGGAGS